MEFIEGTGISIRTNEDGKWWVSKDIVICKEETQKSYLEDLDKYELISLVMLLLKQKIVQK